MDKQRAGAGRRVGAVLKSLTYSSTWVFGHRVRINMLIITLAYVGIVDMGIADAQYARETSITKEGPEQRLRERQLGWKREQQACSFLAHPRSRHSAWRCA